MNMAKLYETLTGQPYPYDAGAEWPRSEPVKRFEAPRGMVRSKGRRRAERRSDA